MIDNIVILGISGSTAYIFNEEFPELKKIDIVPYNIKYSRYLPVTLSLMFDLFRIFRVIKREHAQLENIIREHKIDVVISDNRFGLYHPLIESVYITHQLTIKAGVFSGLANSIHHRFIKKFNHVWVPDFADPERSLAGELSVNTVSKHAKYIGPLSRLDASVIKTDTYDILCLLSGVEPQRSMLEVKLIECFKGSAKKICLVRGTKDVLKVEPEGNFTVIDLPNAGLLAQCIRNSTAIICRSGYSTLMDLHKFQKKELILIPTPGQTEQLYLAHYWQKKYGAKVLKQRNSQNFEFD